MLAVGLMSGTSLDGIDAVLCDICGSGNTTRIKQLEFTTLPLSSEIKEKIKRCCNNQATVAQVCSLNFELGELFAKAVQSVCKQYGVKTTQLGFIASHGQTIYHIPRKTSDYAASTLQIGESAVIAQRCGCPCIANFRVKDMAAGGEGAPLVPFSEYILYSKKDEAVALQNIGGIGNVTVLPANGSIDDVFAFDTGPGNMVIDEAMQCLFNLAYDDNGTIASKGKLIEPLMEQLKKDPYLSLVPPKTTGREVYGSNYTHQLLNQYNTCNPEDIIATLTWFTAREVYGSNYTHQLLNQYNTCNPEDIIATLTWFTAYSIAENYRRFILDKHDVKKVILGGGGAHNASLRHFLANELPGIEVLTQEDLGYSSDAKEAIAFVILGNETMHHQFSNVPKATGAKQKVILGNVTYPN